LNELFLELERRGRDDLAEEGFADGDIAVERSLDMKYVDQVHECSVAIPPFEVTAERVPEIEDAFHRRHEALYTYCELDNTPELINVEVTVYGRTPQLTVPELVIDGPAPPEPYDERRAYFPELGGHRSTPVYAGSALRPAHVVTGPAIVQEETTTIVVYPGLRLDVPSPDLYVMSPAGE
jgi:N-methylhydantoinase A